MEELNVLPRQEINYIVESMILSTLYNSFVLYYRKTIIMLTTARKSLLRQ